MPSNPEAKPDRLHRLLDGRPLLFPAADCRAGLLSRQELARGSILKSELAENLPIQRLCIPTPAGKKRSNMCSPNPVCSDELLALPDLSDEPLGHGLCPLACECPSVSKLGDETQGNTGLIADDQTNTDLEDLLPQVAAGSIPA